MVTIVKGYVVWLNCTLSHKFNHWRTPSTLLETLLTLEVHLEQNDDSMITKLLDSWILITWNPSDFLYSLLVLSLFLLTLSRYYRYNSIIGQIFWTFHFTLYPFILFVSTSLFLDRMCVVLLLSPFLGSLLLPSLVFCTCRDR